MTCDAQQLQLYTEYQQIRQKKGSHMAQPVIVNNPGPTKESGSGMGFLLGVLLLIIFLILLFYYGVPYLRRTVSGPQITVPEQIDVNINQE